ncbi:tail fiber domain-containing protein [Limosilactobacillus fermentum]|uniref:tail fiber domain-containing protein n=1 Tax=Limosilactobacillus fermentum TaxID=1613 RepID=UPI003899EBEA
MPMDNVTLENTQQSISSRDAKSVASVMVNGKWVNLSDTLEQANVKSDVGTVAKQVAAQQEVVSNAVSTADSAVAYANDAIEKSKVNSQAIVAQSEAISEAKSAIDSATAEIQQAVANAASDAANIRADVAQVQNEVDTAKAANSASVEALKSDVSATKQDLADVHDSLTKAQAAAEDSQKAIDKSIAQINDSVAATNKDLEGVRNDLTKAQSDITANQKSINDNVAQINSDIEQDRKDIASAQQANADTAKQLDAYSKQAQDQGKTIKSIQDKQDGFTATLADVQGNVTQVSDKVDDLSANLKDAQNNVASVKAQADQLSATLTDHAKSITTLTASAKEVSSTLEDADGRLSKVEQTAKTNSSTLSDVQGDLSQVKQDATTLTSTLKDAQGNISTLQQKADSVSAQLASAQGDITSLQTDVKGIKATLVSHDGDIHTLQADSKTLKDDMQDAQGNISSLQKTATSLNSEISSQDGRLSKVEQTATEHTSTISSLGDKLNNMKIGGRNLLIGTSEDELSGKSYDFAQYQISGGLQPGTTYILSGWARVDQKAMDNQQHVFVYAYTSNWSWGGVLNIDQSLTAKYNTVTFTTPSGEQQFSPNIDVYLSHPNGDSYKDSISGMGYISKLKLEKGNVATDWSPAPEDMATVTQVKQTSDSITTTLKNVQGDVDQVTQKANGTSEQLADVKGDVTNIQKDVSGLKQTTADNAGNINTLQSDSKSLHDSMQDVQGNISTLQKTSTDVTSELQDHAGRISKVEQTASTLTNEFSDQDGRLSKVEQTATGTQQTVANQQGQINSILTDVSGINETITGQGNQIAKINVTLNGLDTKYEGVSGDLGKLKDHNDWKTVTGAFDANQYTNTARIFYQDTNAKNTPNTGWFYLIVDAPSTSRITQKLIRDNTTDTWTRVYNGSWQAWTKGATQTDVTALSGQITTNSTQITQNKQAIALKADQSTVDNLSGEVSQNTAQLKVQADQISSKVTSTDVNNIVDSKGFATTNTVQSLITQKADDWNVNLTKLKNDTQTSLTNLAIGVEGVQAQVYNSDGSSKITQLSNLIATKVSQGDYNSQITQLKNDINLRVTKGDVISQINQEAGGNTLIQVSNGNGSLILDAANTIVKGKEWIPVAAIADLTADQIQAGTLKGVKVDFRDSTGTGMIADGSTLTFDVSNTPAGYLSYNGMPVAELPDGSGGNELAIRYGLSTAIIPDDNSGAQATFSKAAQKIAYMTGTSRGKQMLSGLEVHSNNHHWLCAVNSDATCNRFEVNDHDGLNIAWHDNTHFFISDGNAKLYKDNDDSPTATKLEVHGWAWVNGWVEAAGHSQHSALSTKTDIQAIDDDEMLAMVNNTDLASFLFKTDVASGETHRHIGLIIDDVHDVAQYQAPQDFIAPNGVSRDDDNMIGALFGAVKALTKRIKTLESKVG